MWGALAATSEANLAVCWELRLLGVVTLPLQIGTKGVQDPALPSVEMVKMRPVRTISREVFVTPQRLHAKHPFWGW
jgi:hypothetical protein